MDIIVMAMIAVDVLLIAALIVLVLQFLKLKRLVIGISASRVPVTTPAMIQDWQKKMALHAVGTPKYTAYRNRLKQVGGLKE